MREFDQSGASHMIKSVEEDFGFRIFLRGRDGVSLTPDGERVIPALREIVKWNESLGQTVSAINGLIRGQLRIGSFTSIDIHWLPKIIRRFQENYPNISIDITEGGISALESALEEGAVDLTFMSVQPGRSFDRILLRKAPFLAILTPDGGREKFPAGSLQRS